MNVLVFNSCNTKPLKVIFESSQNDSATSLNEIKVYKLKKKTINSDFNYQKLENIDGLNNNLMPVFEPVNGNFTFYQFVATLKGWSYKGDDDISLKSFHDILIIKTDKENKILDAYQYTLEWSEPPLQFDLYKSTAENLILKNDLDISSLKLIRTQYWNDKDRFQKESGLIKLK